MNAKYYCIIFGVVMSFFVGCEGNSDSNKMVDLNLKKDISLKDLFAKVEVVPLETNEKSLIKQVDKIIKYESDYYIFDEGQKAVLVFDEKGHFRNKIQSIGRGPGEYDFVRDFELNPFTRKIELLNPFGRLYIFDLNGKFQETIVLPSEISTVHYFRNLSEDVVVFYSMVEEKRIIIYSKKENRILSWLHEIPDFIGAKTPLNPGRSPFVQIGDTVGFYDVFSNDVFSFEKNKIKKIHTWSFGKYDFDVKDLPKNKSLEFYLDYFKDNQDKYVYNFFYNIYSKKHVFTGFLFKGKLTHAIYDNETEESVLFESFKEKLKPPIGTSFKEGIIGVVSPKKTHLYVNEKVLSENSLKVLENVKIDDNPVLINYYYR